MGNHLKLGPTALTGEGVEDAEAVLDQQSLSGWMVSLDFRKGAGDTWTKITSDAACAPQGAPERRVVITLDNKIISAPGVTADVVCGTGITGGSTQISGGFGRAEARELAALVKGGALPVPLDVVVARKPGPGASRLVNRTQRAPTGPGNSPRSKNPVSEAQSDQILCLWREPPVTVQGPAVALDAPTGPAARMTARFDELTTGPKGPQAANITITH
ncbi:hypothetical protein Snoj_28740 [Streptomyces nojiriensis]|uniref:SecDF P1 head subdomain domain-containing protein n=1 Tax=Streptomyces nojiriensis TaxID=66374 RepID=A0ABQ3SLE8_9ACTN|nr:Protein translocase subunit SecD [Streptomyces nojiriensis]GGS37911.1 hypothetical protein GCM10010205_79740 [Streptomyces nojiriensis]GHI68956.1 hypothetical protein Snoj_28740 [Streptomyces nojiriensis]